MYVMQDRECLRAFVDLTYFANCGKITSNTENVGNFFSMGGGIILVSYSLNHPSRSSVIKWT